MRRKLKLVLMLVVTAVLTAVVCVRVFNTQNASVLGCEIVSLEDIAALTQGKAEIDCDHIIFNGGRVNRSGELGAFLITQPKSGEFTSGIIKADEGVQLYAVKCEERLLVVAVKGENFWQAEIMSTSLPTMYLATEDEYSVAGRWINGYEHRQELFADPLREQEIYCAYSVFEVSDNVVRVQNGRLSFHQRGNTAWFFPKKSLRVHLLSADGGKKNKQLLGLRKDDDWILQSLYTDNLSIREQLSLEVWNNIAAIDGVPHDTVPRLSLWSLSSTTATAEFSACWRL